MDFLFFIFYFFLAPLPLRHSLLFSPDSNPPPAPVVVFSCPQLNTVPFEPPHGAFFRGYPWSRYEDISDSLRYAVYDIIGLDGCLRAEIQAPPHLRHLFKDEMACIGTQCARWVTPGSQQTPKPKPKPPL